MTEREALIRNVAELHRLDFGVSGWLSEESLWLLSAVNALRADPMTSPLAVAAQALMPYLTYVNGRCRVCMPMQTGRPHYDWCPVPAFRAALEERGGESAAATLNSLITFIGDNSIAASYLTMGDYRSDLIRMALGATPSAAPRESEPLGQPSSLSGAEGTQPHTFTCPECGGHYFGSALDGKGGITARECHDQGMIGCRWRGGPDDGMADEWKSRTASPSPVGPESKPDYWWIKPFPDDPAYVAGVASGIEQAVQVCRERAEKWRAESQEVGPAATQAAIAADYCATAIQALLEGENA
jgi:hypothetical protein